MIKLSDKKSHVTLVDNGLCDEIQQSDLDICTLLNDVEHRINNMLWDESCFLKMQNIKISHIQSPKERQRYYTLFGLSAWIINDTFLAKHWFQQAKQSGVNLPSRLCPHAWTVSSLLFFNNSNEENEPPADL